MDKKLPELSLFFPFWNEEKNIKDVVTKAVPIIKKYSKKWEIIMVDDGSDDKTKQIAEEIANSDPQHFRIISHKPNRGYGAALKEGLINAKYNFVAFTDGDGQFDISELERFVENIEDNDIVIGYRKRRRDKIGRHILMYLLKIWDLILFRFYFKDIDCGFKMFTRHAIEELSPLRSEGAMITTEILAKAKRKNLTISQVEVTHYPRKKGTQSGANFQVIARAVFESFILWWDLRYGRF